MIKETFYKECYVNGTRSCVCGYNDGSHRLLYFGESLGCGVGVDDIKAAGVSRHQYTNAMMLSGTTVSDIQAVIPGAVVEFEGSPEYEARRAAARGTRGGKKETASAASVPAAAAPADPVPADPVPAASAPSAVELPTVDASGVLGSALSSAVGGLAPMVASAILPAVNTWAAGLVEETAKVAKSDAPQVHIFTDLSGVERGRVNGKLHKNFDAALNIVRMSWPIGRHLYLWGPAGTGKSYMAGQIASALGLTFSLVNRAVEKYDLVGYTGPAGNIVETSLTRAVLNGGVILFDEMDSWSSEALTAMSSLLAAGEIDLPGRGLVKVHKDFYIIAAGNTAGLGDDPKYQRLPFPEQINSRLIKINISYDKKLETEITDPDAAGFIQSLRAAASKIGFTAIDFSPRCSIALHALGAVSDDDVFTLSAAVLSGVDYTDIDSINELARNIDGSGRWFTALKNLIKVRSKAC